MPLTFAEVGKQNLIKKINGKNKTKNFLESLGFIVNEKVTIVSKFQGNLIVNIKGTRVAIDKTMANRIMI
ncbi:ferrous iron transport protein A [Clostridium sp. D2Q-14]|uniref:FeoA family protein n=1 Tax=Anaeromonas gelatinilytica TaxID=2683194 RepID=UPI00193B4098|nr:FeoA family protein [Anaeromonas gelatinilytica]MBS4535076.1 ferrous iron transport protein A [Anaeromonas gelatinilytica]